ncbi:hypothetical protein [Endozoicomonas montiporae]|uniref:Uncharacterized protein n=1 Tax=Endozoicomonas montiporae CL-33 TaxID=570277 RepID=A0A142B810_9GAMM|nr:hypothetical protein [Endozoicomonas montiporae]AMO54886.1 hypothetical protein EZMO1_0647 [Endozoicomonas montiporae CL-33]
MILHKAAFQQLIRLIKQQRTTPALISILFCLQFSHSDAMAGTELEKFTLLHKNTVELFVAENKGWFRHSLKAFRHYLEKHPPPPYQEYFDLFFVPVANKDHSNKAAESVFITYPEPFLDKNSPNHKTYKQKAGYEQYSSEDGTVAGLTFSKANPIKPQCSDESLFHDSQLGFVDSYSSQQLFNSSSQYEHAYFKPVDYCDSSVKFQKGGENDQFLLMSLCVSDSSDNDDDRGNQFEVCIPMGPAQQFSIDDIIDPHDEFSPLPEYTEESIELFLSHLERQYDPENPAANRHVGSLLGRGISAQVMEPVSFLHSAAIKRVIKEVPDTRSAEEFILTAQINMRLLTMAEIRYLPLIYFHVPARKKGKVALYGVQKKCDSEQFLDHLFEDPGQPMPAMEKLLDDIIDLLVECDTSNAKQLRTLLPASTGFSLAVDPNYANYFYDGTQATVVDLTPFFMAFEGETPAINHQFLDMELEGIATHFDDISMNPLHRYLFFLGMLFRTCQNKLIAFRQCIFSEMDCTPEKKQSNFWYKLFDHALLKIASKPPVHNEITRLLKAQQRVAWGQDSEANSDVSRAGALSVDSNTRGGKAYVSYHSDILTNNKHQHAHKAMSVDQSSPIVKFLQMEASLMSARVDQWKKDRWLKWIRDVKPHYKKQQNIHTLESTPCMMSETEAKSYANFILGLESSKAHSSANGLWISISNWLERNRHINSGYTGSLSAPDLRRMSQMSASRAYDEEFIKLWGDSYIPLLLKALASRGFHFHIQVVQPDKHFQPHSKHYWFDVKKKIIVKEIIDDVQEIRRLAENKMVLSLLLHQTSDVSPGLSKSHWSEVSPLSSQQTAFLLRYPMHEVASWRFDTMDRFVVPLTSRRINSLDQDSSYYLKLTLMINAYQRTVIPSDPAFMFEQLLSHLPASDQKAKITPGTRIGHMFMALLLWLDSQVVLPDNNLPNSVLLIHPALGYSVNNPAFSVWTFSIPHRQSGPDWKTRVITRELTHNIKLESINTNDPGQLIFYTNTMISKTGHLISPHHFAPEWWIVNKPEIMDLPVNSVKLFDEKSFFGKRLFQKL